MFAFGLYTFTDAHALVNYTVRDELFHGMPHVQKTLLQFVNVVNMRPVDTQLYGIKSDLLLRTRHAH